MEKKSILIVDPFEKMSKILVEELRALGYNAIPLFKGKMKSFDYDQISNFDKFQNIFQRLFLKNNNYYHVLIDKFYKRYTEILLDKIVQEKIKIDYILVFRPHGFSTKFYKQLQKLTSNISLYEYDGLDNSRTLALNKSKNYAKNVFLFDYNDLEKVKNSKFITNYHYNLDAKIVRDNKIDFYYLGSSGNNRISQLQNFIKRTSNFISVIMVQVGTMPTEENTDIQFITESIQYEDYLHNIRETRAIIDIKSPRHSGLSFRFFEALNLEKKIITNNKSVVHYNFYHPDNIFITDFESFDGLEEFMHKPYHPISEDIVKTYSLENWIMNIFEMDNYTPIPLPKIKK